MGRFDDDAGGGEGRDGVEYVMRRPVGRCAKQPQAAKPGRAVCLAVFSAIMTSVSLILCRVWCVVCVRWLLFGAVVVL